MLRIRMINVGLLLVVIAAAAALAGSTFVNASERPARSISALDRAPAAATLPPAAAAWAGVVSKRSMPAAAVKRLRADLGSKRADVYAYRTAAGGVCFLYVGFAGTCSSARHLRQTGAQWTIGAGTLVALVTDDVRTVALSVDGRAYPTSRANNIVFAEFPPDSSTAVIDVNYASGEMETSTVRLGLPAGASPPRPNSHP